MLAPSESTDVRLQCLELLDFSNASELVARRTAGSPAGPRVAPPRTGVLWFASREGL